MSAEDEEAYGVLNWFIDGFFPARWVTREGRDILNEDGEPTFEARPINTKVLVEYRSYGRVMDLLGFCLLDFTILLLSFFCFVFPRLTRGYRFCFYRKHGGTLREAVEADPREEKPQEVGEATSAYTHGFSF